VIEEFEKIREFFAKICLGKNRGKIAFFKGKKRYYQNGWKVSEMIENKGFLAFLPDERVEKWG
jgi:hypothetical protein